MGGVFRLAAAGSGSGPAALARDRPAHCPGRPGPARRRTAPGAHPDRVQPPRARHRRPHHLAPRHRDQGIGPREHGDGRDQGGHHRHVPDRRAQVHQARAMDHPQLRAERSQGDQRWRRDHFLFVHRVRRGEHGLRGGQESAAGHSAGHHRIVDRVHAPVRRHRARPDGADSLGQAECARSAGGRAAVHPRRLGGGDPRARRGGGDDVGAPRIPAWPGAHLHVHGARRPAPTLGRPRAPEIQDSAHHHHHYRRVRRRVGGLRADRLGAGAHEHRYPVRVHPRGVGDHRATAARAGPGSPVPHALGAGLAARVGGVLPLLDDQPATAHLGAVRLVDGDRGRHLLPLRRAPQPGAPPRPRSAVKLHTKIIIGLLSGACLGVVANAFATGAAWVAWTAISAEWAADKVQWVGNNVAGPVGQVFLRMLLMTIVPLVFASLTLGVAGLGDIRKIGRVGGRTIAYFLVSTAISAAIGLILVNLVRPGVGLDPALVKELLATYRAQPQGLQAGGGGRLGLDMFVNLVPKNPIKAAASLDMLGIIFFSLVFGASLTLLPEEKTRPMVRVLDALGEAIVKIIDFAMRLAPYGVFGLIFVVTSRFGFALLQKLGLYVAVVLVGLLLHGAISISALVRVFGGLSPRVFYSRIRASIITAFSTSSSNATLPTNIAVAERGLKIPPKIAGFVLPLGSTMCMNGTALFEGVTVLFLAQVFSVPLTLSQQVVVMLLSVITAVGAAGVPGGSLPLLMGVLAAVNVEPLTIALIIGVDRILDMTRTTINVVGDMSAAVYVARTESEWDPRVISGEARPAPAA